MKEKNNDISKEIEKSQSTKYHRGKSWEHCYVFFGNHEKFSDDEKLLDFAALHLGFFLASWGMLRGSSFLLQKDYKFYVPIVKILIDKEYDRLWNIDFLNRYEKDDIDILFKLRDELEKKISENNIVDGDNDMHEMNLIITKTIMGTMGCVPGYDRFFKDGLKDYFKKQDIKYVNFNKKSFINLLKLVNNDKKLVNLYKGYIDIKESNIKYPPMKLLDLFFWLSGFEKDNQKTKPKK